MYCKTALGAGLLDNVELGWKYTRQHILSIEEFPIHIMVALSRLHLQKCTIVRDLFFFEDDVPRP